jgi:ArsR family transcriptional regulator, arsenate/arsenite/antimonite-responsive transcriptional repressor
VADIRLKPLRHGQRATLSIGHGPQHPARRLAELGNVTRLQIVPVQAGAEGLAIGEVQSQLGVPASTLAFHVRGLVAAGLADQKREGRVVRCRSNIATINGTLAFVKENCCAGHGKRVQLGSLFLK